jgi:hypothetical protein
VPIFLSKYLACSIAHSSGKGWSALSVFVFGAGYHTHRGNVRKWEESVGSRLEESTHCNDRRPTAQGPDGSGAVVTSVCASDTIAIIERKPVNKNFIFFARKYSQHYHEILKLDKR